MIVPWLVYVRWTIVLACGKKQSHKQRKRGGERERERGGGGGETDREGDVCHYIHFSLFYNPDCPYVSKPKINAHVDVISSAHGLHFAST